MIENHEEEIKKYTNAAKIALLVIKEVEKEHELNKEVREELFSAILQSELDKYQFQKFLSLQQSKKYEPTQSEAIGPSKDLDELSVQDLCLAILAESFDKVPEGLSAIEVYQILREKYRIPTNVNSVSARLGELTKKRFVLRERYGKIFKYKLSRAGQTRIGESVQIIEE